MRQAFQDELDSLQNQLDQLFELVELAFIKVYRALDTNDRSLAQKVRDEDGRLNQAQLELEEAAALLIARQQPVAKDLRQIVSVMQMSSDLEKIGDYSALIAKSILRLEGQPGSDQLKASLVEFGDPVRNLSSLVRRLVHDQKAQDLEAVEHLEEQLVEARKALSATIRRQMDKEADLVLSGTYYLSIALHMERMADYLTNICERLVYIETGQLVDRK